MKSCKTKNLLKSFIAILSAAVITVPAFYVQADTVEELESKTSNLQNQISGLNQQLSSLGSEIDELVAKIETTDKEIEHTELELAAAKLSQESQYQAMKMRIKYMYENGETSLLEFICSAQSMSEFLNNTEFVSAITEYDREMLETLQEVTQKVTDKEQELEAQKVELAAAKEKLDGTRASLTSTINQVQGDLNISTQQLSDAKAAEAAAQAALAREKEKERAENTSAGQAASTAPASSGGGNSTSQSPSMPASTSEIALFAAILHCEALQNDYDALLAVATIIMNRIESPRWPNTLHDVIYQKNQFSPVRTGKLDRILAQGPTAMCYTVAQDALNGARLDKVKHCYSFRMVGTWSNGIVVGDNIFY